jgi:hypothetical protein
LYSKIPGVCEKNLKCFFGIFLYCKFGSIQQVLIAFHPKLAIQRRLRHLFFSPTIVCRQFIHNMFIFNHQIAGINFWTDTDVQISHLLQPSFIKFSVEDTQPDVRFRIEQLKAGLPSLPPLTPFQKERLLKTVGFPSSWLGWLILRSPQVWSKVDACLDRPELAQISLRWYRAVIRNFSRNELDFFYPLEQKDDFSDPFFIAPHRTMLSVFLPNFSAVMLHGAGVIRNGTALLFLAPDEGGKSSTVKLAAGMSVLSDDQIILRKQDDLIIAHGTPFGPLTSGPQHSKLGAIFLLEKASQFALTPVSVSDIVQFIWNDNNHLWFVMPKNLRKQAFELIVDACQQAKVYRMQFPKGFVDWNLIDEAIHL